MISPNVKLGDLPFFDENIPSTPPNTKVTYHKDGSPINMWQQTVAEFIKANLNAPPVPGDMVKIDEEWALIIKEVDNRGTLRTIGLKHYQAK